MIKLEAQEIRGTPVIKLHFAPQSEQFTGLGRALSAFVKYAEDDFHKFDKGNITFGWEDMEIVASLGEIKKPKEEYKDVSLHTGPRETEPVIIAVAQPDINIVQQAVAQIEELPVVQPKVRKKKVDIKPSSI